MIVGLASSNDAASFVGTADEVVSTGTLQFRSAAIASNEAIARTNEIALSFGTEVIF